MENDLEERVARAICAYWCAEAGKMLGEFDPCIFSKRKSACKSWPNEIGCARVAIAAMRDSADEKARTE